MKVVVYARVSTDEQAASGLSLNAQEKKLKGYADLYDLDVVESIVDAGQSAKTLRRPGLQRALELLKSGKADGLVVVKLDRLTRSVSDWQLLIDGYFGESAGKALFSVSDSIDTRTAGGRLVLNVLLSVAQWEREAIAERTRDALRSKIDKGERVGSVRYGYTLQADGVSLEPDDREQRVRRMIISMHYRGISSRRIAGELDRRGILTKTGKSAWKHTAVLRIITREKASNTKRTVASGRRRVRGIDQQPG